MKTLQYTIATVVFGALALLIAPIVTGKSTSAPAAANAILPAAPVPQSVIAQPVAEKKTPPVAVAQPVVLAQNTPAPKPAAAEPPPAPAKAAKAGLTKAQKNCKLADAFFAGPVVQLEFTFKNEEWENLKKDNRRYAECEMDVILPTGAKTHFKGVGVKLKGSAGSFRGPEDKPGVTVTFDKYKGGERCFGMDKFHLNNGAQDGSLLNEFIGGEMCRATGVPASRCTHVLVKWNGKDNGLYLLKEAFTKDFLSYFYEKTDGSLYDGHFIAEIDGNLEKQQGGDPNNKADLQALVAACKEGDAKVRWAKLAERLDVDEYLRSLCMEIFLTHWDGYNFNRNNYRVYFDSKTGKAAFFCHGIDQLFGDSNWPIVRDPESLVGQAVWSNPDWKARYKVLAEEIYRKVIKAKDWDAVLIAQGKKIQDALDAKLPKNPQLAKDYQGEINGARERVKNRLTNIARQFNDGPKPIDWRTKAVKIGDKDWRGEGSGAKDEVAVDGQKCYHIRADADASASWRRTLQLPPGHYKFTAMAKVAGVAGPVGKTGEGAGLRISGGTRVGLNGIKGSTQWQNLAFEFDAADADVVLVAELSTPAGEAWFLADSMQLIKLR